MAATLPAAAVRGLVNNPRIRLIEPDVAVFAIGAELTNGWGVAQIGAGLVHESSNKGAGVRVAILDSGVDYTHPDLALNYAGGKDFINNDDDRWMTMGTVRMWREVLWPATTTLAL